MEKNMITDAFPNTDSRLDVDDMNQRSKKSNLWIWIVILILWLPLLGYLAILFIISPHTYHFFIDREKVSEEFNLDLTDDVKLVSYCDRSFLCVIDSELIVEVNDPEEFLKNNITCDIEKADPSSGDDYKYNKYATGIIHIRIEPYEDKYRVHLNYID